MNLPSVTTNEVSEIAWNSAVVECEVFADGNSGVKERGVCWSTQGDPTTDDYHAYSGDGVGSYNIILTGLEPKTVSQAVYCYEFGSAEDENKPKIIIFVDSMVLRRIARLECIIS